MDKKSEAETEGDVINPSSVKGEEKSSDPRMTELDLNLQKNIHLLEQNVETHELHLMQTSTTLKGLRQRLEALMEEKETMEEHLRPDFYTDYFKTKQNITECQMAEERQTNDLTFEKKAVEKRIKFLIAEAELYKLKLEADVDTKKQVKTEAEVVVTPEVGDTTTNVQSPRTSSTYADFYGKPDVKPSTSSWDFRSPQFPDATLLQQSQLGFPNSMAQQSQPIQDGSFVNQLAAALSQAFGKPDKKMIVKDSLDKDLPHFTGKPEEWPIFYNEFIRTTKKYEYDMVENAVRLRKCLKGSARKLVHGLLDDPDSVEKIINTLKNHYGRPEYMLDSLIVKVKEAKPPDDKNPQTLIDFGTAVQNLVARIMTLQESRYLNDVTLLKELVNKLPVLYGMQWLDWLNRDVTREKNLFYFAQWLEEQVIKMVQLRKPVVEDISDENKSNRRPKRGTGAVNVTDNSTNVNPSPSTSARPSTTARTEPSNKECPACNKRGHKLNTCRTFENLSLESRWHFVRENHICFCCLKGQHLTRECKSGKECDVDDCRKRHHPLLHSNGGNQKKSRLPVPPPIPEVPKQNEYATEDEAGALGAAVIKGAAGPLSIVPVRIRGPEGTRRTYALMDSGANQTLIEKSLATELGITGDRFEHQFTGVGGKLTINKSAMRVNMDICGNFRGAHYSSINNAITVDNLGFRPYSVDVDEAKRKWPHLRKAQAKSLINAVPRIIIGEDNGYLTMHRQLLYSTEDAPIAKRTRLGWVLAGNLNKDGTVGSSFHINGSPSNEEIHDMVKESFTVENFGITPATANESKEDKRALAILEDTSKKVGDRWEVGLLWREDNVSLPESKQHAIRRLGGIERKAKKFPEFATLYKNKIQEYLNKGYIRKLSEEEAATENEKTWYIPHFGVTNPNKPGKFRLVFDAAAKSHGVCLNDKLLKGPDLIRPLTSVLWNFRRHPIALNGDIEDMFHRVRIREEDQVSQRFLWRDFDDSRPPDVYQMTVMIFGASSSPASAIFIKNKNAEVFKDFYPVAVQIIKEDFYVDDCLSGADDVDSAIKLREEISYINKAGGFVVKKWHSNSPEVLASIPEELRADGVKTLKEKADIPSERVLGLWWDPWEDIFYFKMNFHKVKADILEGRRPTKREVCSLVMSLYDPLGFIGHFKIKGMMLLQSTWRCGVDWEDEIPDIIFERWKLWVSTIPSITQLKISRAYHSSLKDASNIQLHTYVDASKEAFAAVSYLRICDESGSVETAFVSSKVKVAPIKALTIPRLELQAALLGTRLALTIMHELKVNISTKLFWTDAKTVLFWIKSDTLRYHEFVANRIGEIQESTSPNEWKWVSTTQNVADDATRYAANVEFLEDSRWLTGSEFMKQDPSYWPEQKKLAGLPDDPEVKPGVVFAAATAEKEESFVNFERYSSYHRLCRAYGGALAVAEYWKSKLQPSKNANAVQPPWNIVQFKVNSRLSSDHVGAGEMYLIKAVQNECFADELKPLKMGQPLTQKQKLYKLSPVIDANGILRLRGRVDNAVGISDEQKRPIILPSRHKFTDLLVDQEHVRNAHQGQETVLNNIRQRFWIIDARQAVKRSWLRCLDCRIRTVKPIVPEMGPLPYYRLASKQPPFTYTGVDFFGPMEVTVGRHHEKRWGCLFCCMVTRGVHIEVAHSLSTDEMIMALSRFIDIRGRPHHLFSDNGTNFVGAARELREELKKINFDLVMNNEKYRGIKWNFIPPSSPHMGGAWERLIQAVKKAVARLLKEKFPRDTTLLTVLKAAENIVNSRPLAHVSCDPADPESITPNHFLRGGSDAGSSIPGNYDASDEFLRTQWRISQCMADRFWNYWTTSYLPELVRREKWHQAKEPLQVGDLVFIVDDQQPRNTWIRGIITKTFPGSDGQVRVVEVTTRDFTKKKTSVYRRPVTKICPLGLRAQDSGLI